MQQSQHNQTYPLQHPFLCTSEPITPDRLAEALRQASYQLHMWVG